MRRTLFVAIVLLFASTVRAQTTYAFFKSLDQGLLPYDLDQKQAFGVTSNATKAGFVLTSFVTYTNANEGTVCLLTYTAQTTDADTVVYKTVDTPAHKYVFTLIATTKNFLTYQTWLKDVSAAQEWTQLQVQNTVWQYLWSSASFIATKETLVIAPNYSPAIPSGASPTLNETASPLTFSMTLVRALP